MLFAVRMKPRCRLPCCQVEMPSRHFCRQYGIWDWYYCRATCWFCANWHSFIHNWGTASHRRIDCFSGSIHWWSAYVVNLDLAEERDLATTVNGNISNDFEAEEYGSETGQPDLIHSPGKFRKVLPYDPSASQRVWLVESFVKIGVPLLAGSWEGQEHRLLFSIFSLLFGWRQYVS